MTAIDIITSSPYSSHVKRAVYAIYISKYYKPRGSTYEEEVYNVEDYVLTHGIFIGAMSRDGFFYCEDIEDVIMSFWLSLMDDLDVPNQTPSKLFVKKISELYQEATQLFP